MSRHVNNLRYIEMCEDAHESAFWLALQPREMEICFLSQGKEGETLSVRSRVGPGLVHLAALHADVRIAAVAEFRA